MERGFCFPREALLGAQNIHCPIDTPKGTRYTLIRQSREPASFGNMGMALVVDWRLASCNGGKEEEVEGVVEMTHRVHPVRPKWF